MEYESMWEIVDNDMRTMVFLEKCLTTIFEAHNEEYNGMCPHCARVKAVVDDTKEKVLQHYRQTYDMEPGYA